jgi:Fe-S cluster biosynthesis and repair protein YggX
LAAVSSAPSHSALVEDDRPIFPSLKDKKAVYRLGEQKAIIFYFDLRFQTLPEITPVALFASCYNVSMPRMVKCAKLGRELPGLDERPFDTELGQKIYENVSAEAWRMWAEHSKMLLNEYRLQPWKPEAQQFLVEQMQQYFFGAGAQLPKEFVPPPK